MSSESASHNSYCLNVGSPCSGQPALANVNSQAELKKGGPLMDAYLAHTSDKRPIVSNKVILNAELDGKAAETWYMLNIGTDPTMRGSGLGSVIVKELHAILDEQVGKQATMFLHTTGAVRLFFHFSDWMYL